MLFLFSLKSYLLLHKTCIDGTPVKASIWVFIGILPLSLTCYTALPIKVQSTRAECFGEY
jgi:hypothetical protein